MAFLSLRDQGSSKATKKHNSAGKFCRDGNGIEKGAEQMCFGMRGLEHEKLSSSATTFDTKRSEPQALIAMIVRANERPGRATTSFF